MLNQELFESQREDDLHRDLKKAEKKLLDAQDEHDRALRLIEME